MTKKHAPQYFICSLNFKSHNFQTESHYKCVAPTYRGSATLSFLVLQLYSTLRTLWIQNPAHVKQCVLQEAKNFLYQTIQSVVRAESAQTIFYFFWDQEIFAFCKSSSHHSSGWLPMSSAKVFFQETTAWYRTLAIHQNEYLPQVCVCFWPQVMTRLL